MAMRVLASVQGADQYELLEEGHFRRALGEDPLMTPWDRKILDAFEFPGDWDAETLCEQALKLLHDWFGFVPGQEQKPTHLYQLPCYNE